MGDRKNVRRLIIKARPIVKKGGIVFLQETHITDTNYLKSLNRIALNQNQPE